MQWRATGTTSGQWAALDERPRGRGEIRYAENGDTMFKTRVTVLPPNFSCRVEPGLGIREGALLLATKRRDTPEELRIRIAIHRDGLRYSINAGLAIVTCTGGHPVPARRR